jgi:hypothetical protein
MNQVQDKFEHVLYRVCACMYHVYLYVQRIYSYVLSLYLVFLYVLRTYQSVLSTYKYIPGCTVLIPVLQDFVEQGVMQTRVGQMYSSSKENARQGECQDVR